MFFILSKVFNFVTTPLVLVCVCFLVSIFIRKQRLKTIFFWIGFGLLLLFSNQFIANEIMLAWEIKATPFNDVKKHKLAIVLTGANLTGLTPADRVYFGRGADRVIHTVQLYKLGLVDKILVSGGSGSLRTVEEKEAISFKRAMMVMGVPEIDIVTESETRNTHESAEAVKKILLKMQYQPNDCLLVTSAFHMRRSLACYQKVGLDIESFSTDFYSSPRRYSIDYFLVPEVGALLIWHKVLREWTGFLAYKMAGYI